MKRYRLYLFDLDGTLFRGNEATPHGPESVARLRVDGAEVRFLTNNSGKTREELAAKLRGLGYEAKPSEVYGTAMGAARLCRERGFASAFVVGEQSLASTLLESGIAVVNRTAWDCASPDPAPERDAQVVVAGICRTFTYAWMNWALQQTLRGAAFVATNEDATYPMEGGTVVPGAGSIVASIRTCSGLEPTVVGKPSPYLVDLALREAGVEASEALVVGDRLDTDLGAGRAAGCDTWLVLTGIESSAPPGQPFGEDLRGLL